MRGKGCAVAIFIDQTLAHVNFYRPETITYVQLRVGAVEVVWEQPQIDARTRVSVPAVVQLAATGGTLAGMFAGACGCSVTSVSPQTWKGGTAKPVAHGRMWTGWTDDYGTHHNGLTLAEQAVLGGSATLTQIEAAKHAGAKARWNRPGGTYYPTSWLTHNLLDAVGIGRWRLGL